MERRRARSMLSNSVSGTKQLSGNGVEWSTSNFPISPPYTSLLEGKEGGSSSSCACANCTVSSFFLGLYQSTLRRTYRAACRHFRRRGELRSKQSSSTRTRLPMPMSMLMLMRENVTIMVMVVRPPHRDRKPIHHTIIPIPIPNICFVFALFFSPHPSYTVPPSGSLNPFLP